jgi:DNA topoisomerase-1
MAKSLIIVESQQKLQTIKSFLNSTDQVYNVNGAVQDGGIEFLHHLVFNDPPQLSFLSEHRMDQLAQIARESDAVLIATTPDFIGDALAHQLVDSLGQRDRVSRLFLPVLSKNDFRTSCKSPTRHPTPNEALLAQSLKVDGTFDFYVRGVLNKKRAKRPIFGLAAAVALKMLCEVDENNSTARRDAATGVQAVFLFKNEKLAAQLVKVNGQPPSIEDKHTAKAIVFDLKEQKIKVHRISDNKQTTAPPLPLTTAKLIAAAERHLGFSPRETMAIARSLYNGCDIGLKSPVGLITYPITDSLFCPEEELLAAREFILVNYGKDYLPAQPRRYAKDNDASFSVIRPTLVSRTPKKVKKHLTKQQHQLYDLIWVRFLASQMTDVASSRRKVTLHAGPQKRYMLVAEQNRTTERGYLQLFPEAANKTSMMFAQEFQKGREWIPHDFEIVQESTDTDFYYTKGRLLEALGDLDVCLTEILELIPDILQSWKFIRITKDGRLYPTRAGISAYHALKRFYPDIVNEQFVRLHKKKYFLKSAKKKRIDPVQELLKLLENSARSSIDENLASAQKTKHTCPLCGGVMLRQKRESGDFMICERYPDSCHYSKLIHSHAQRFYGRCDECNAELTVRVGRYGRFLACSKFPRCKFTKPYPIGAKCPKEGCHGDVIERTTKSGRLFYGCSFYPQCTFSSWQMPVNVACPKCGNLYMVLKDRDDAEHYTCPTCKSEYNKNLDLIKR